MPAVIAVWIAGLGWYAQHQIAMKGHRTTHAFNLIMQTRTNSEYLKHLRALQLVYPPGRNITPEDVSLYPKGSVSQLPRFEAIRDDQAAQKADREAAAEKIRMIEGMNAAKYLLHYFEFMARGIHALT